MPSEFGFETQEERRARDKAIKQQTLAARVAWAHQQNPNLKHLEAHVPQILRDYARSEGYRMSNVYFFADETMPFGEIVIHDRDGHRQVKITIVDEWTVQIWDVPQSDQLAEVLHSATGLTIQILKSETVWRSVLGREQSQPEKVTKIRRVVGPSG